MTELSTCQSDGRGNRQTVAARRSNVRIKVTSREAREIVEQISLETGVPVDAIVIGRGNRAACSARQRAYAEMHKRGATYYRIAWLMDRDRSTVLHGVRKVLGR